MPDLRRVFKNVMTGWGHDVLLQRRVLRSQTGLYGLEDNNGYTEKLERYTVRHRFPRISKAASSQFEAQEGITRDVDILFYFPWDAKPKEGDRIFEPDDRFDDGRTNTGYSSYTIDFALPMRGVGGRVEYWECGCSREIPH